MVRTNRQHNVFCIPGSVSWSSDVPLLLAQALPALLAQDGSQRPELT
jgi:hypothetical protein